MDGFNVATALAATMGIAAAALLMRSREKGLRFPKGGPFFRLGARLWVEPALMRCRQSVRLTPQHTVHIVEFGRDRLLVACHPAGTTLLVSHEKPEEEAHGESGTAA